MDLAQYAIRNPESASAYLQIAGAFQTLTPDLHPVRLKVWRAGRYAIVGLGSQRIEVVRRAMVGINYPAQTFPGFSRGAKRNRELAREEYALWLEKMVREGHTIVDIGGVEVTSEDKWMREINDTVWF